VSSATITAGRRRVTVSRADKPLFPSGVTKGDLARYYADIAPVMLPHVKNRPLNMQRFPDGVGKQGFFHQRAPDHFPDWVCRTTVPRSRGEGSVRHVVACNAATLAYLADQAAITLHIWLSRTDRLDRPDRMVFDLDPSDGAGFDHARRGALALGGLLRDLALEPFAMVTGSRGVHVWVALQRRHDYDTVRTFARDVAELLAAGDDALTTEQRKNKRGGRVLVDIMRNTYGHTAVAPYSVRARPEAPVATPLRWEELESAGLRADACGLRDVLRRAERDGDPWADIGRHAATLGPARRRLDELRA
jgi:bifunctional non-homologous end joining protein LigD